MTQPNNNLANSGEKKILIACEESQAVCIEFRKLGFEAYSCDILPCSGGHPEWHLQGDVTEILKQKWDAIIAFPPCTHLAVSGSRHFAKKIADGRQQQGIDFFMLFTDLDCDFISIENPIGIMSKKYRKPNQIIHPYHFGDPERKATCLWLKGLPKLTPTNIVEPDIVIYKSKKSKSGFSTYSRITGTNPSTNGEHNAKLRSKTYPGIAKAMAEQWGAYILNPTPTTLF